MTSSHFVTVGDLTFLCNIDAYQLVYASWQIIVFVPIKNTYTDNGSGFTVWHLQRSITDFLRLFAEDSTQQALFWCQFGFTLRGDTADQNVSGFNFSTDVNDAAFIELRQDFIRDVWNVTSDFFSAEFGVACIDFVLFNVNRGEHIVGHHALGYNDGVFEVQTFPRHECHENVLTKCQFTVVRGWTVSQYRTVFDTITFGNPNNLVVGVALVGALEFVERVMARGAFVFHNGHEVSGHFGDDTWF